MARALYVIATEIKREWQHPYAGALPFLHAMLGLNQITDRTERDVPGVRVVLYFLANASTWQGPAAIRLKRELNALLPPAEVTSIWV